jgi:type IV pilus assembly protein PilM
MALNNKSRRPKVACEISAERIVAARAGDAALTLEAATTSTLPAGAVVPGLQQTNVAVRETLVTVLREALDTVAGRSRDITLVVPDSTARIILLDFDTLPDKSKEADAVVRFRLKKSLPFDVEQSSVSFDRQSTGNQIRVVAAVMPRNVLDEYESVTREAGYNPGAVVPYFI